VAGTNESVEKKVAQAWPPGRWRDFGVVVAVSGGADSVALLRVLLSLQSSHPAVGAMQSELAVGHFNHRLRGAESDGDAEFVAKLCDRLGVPFHRGVADPLPAGAALSEAAAREQRYAFLQQLAEQLGARYVAAAHTADDQAETILHRVLRGTGLAGLAGMPSVRPLGPAVTLVRPLLGLARDELLGYLSTLQQNFRQDSSNFDLRFARNRIRHELLPLLKEHYAPGVSQSLLRLGALAADSSAIIADLAENLLNEATIEVTPGRVQLHAGRLGARPQHLVRESFVVLWQRQAWPLSQMGYEQWSQLAALTSQPDARDTARERLMMPGAIAAERRDGKIILERAP
jgi:tRNA(Ile)-lysidine synthase